MEGGGCHTFGPPTVTLFDRRGHQKGGSDNPIAESLRKFSGNVIEGRLKKEGKDPESMSPNEKKKHELVSNYAKKLKGDRFTPKQGGRGGGRGSSGRGQGGGNQGKGTA